MLKNNYVLKEYEKHIIALLIQNLGSVYEV